MIKNGGRLLGRAVNAGNTRRRRRSRAESAVEKLSGQGLPSHHLPPAFLLPAWHDRDSFGTSFATVFDPVDRLASTSRSKAGLASKARKTSTSTSTSTSNHQDRSNRRINMLSHHRRSSSSLASVSATRRGEAVPSTYPPDWYLSSFHQDSQSASSAPTPIVSTSKLSTSSMDTLHSPSSAENKQDNRDHVIIHHHSHSADSSDVAFTTQKTANPQHFEASSLHTSPSCSAPAPSYSAASSSAQGSAFLVPESVTSAVAQAREYLRQESATVHKDTKFNDDNPSFLFPPLLPLGALPPELLDSLMYRNAHIYTSALDEEYGLMASARLHGRLAHASRIMKAVASIKSSKYRGKAHGESSTLLSRQASRRAAQAALSELLCWDSKTFGRVMKVLWLRDFQSGASFTDLPMHQVLPHMLLLETIAQRLRYPRDNACMPVQKVLPGQSSTGCLATMDKQTRRLVSAQIKGAGRLMAELDLPSILMWMPIVMHIISAMPEEDAPTAARALQFIGLLSSSGVERARSDQLKQPALSVELCNHAFDLFNKVVRHALDFARKGRRSDRREYLRQLDLRASETWRSLNASMLSTPPQEEDSLNRRLLQIHKLALDGGLVHFASAILLEGRLSEGASSATTTTTRAAQADRKAFSAFITWKDTIRQSIKCEELQCARDLLERIDISQGSPEELSTVMHFNLQIVLQRYKTDHKLSLHDLHAILEQMQSRQIPLDHHFLTTLLRSIPKLDLPMDKRCDLFNAMLDLVEHSPKLSDIAVNDDLNVHLAAIVGDLHLFEQAKQKGIQLPWLPLATAADSSHHSVLDDSKAVINLRNQASALSVCLRLSSLNGNLHEAKGHYRHLLHMFAHITATMRFTDIQAATSHVGRIYSYLREVWLSSFIKLLSMSLRTRDIGTSLEMLRETLGALGPRFVGFQPVRRVLIAACSFNQQDSSMSGLSSANKEFWPHLSLALQTAAEWAQRMHVDEETVVFSEIDLDLTTAGRLRKLRGSRNLRSKLVRATAQALALEFLDNAPDEISPAVKLEKVEEITSQLATTLKALGIGTDALMEDLDAAVVAELAEVPYDSSETYTRRWSATLQQLRLKSVIHTE